MGNQPTKQCGGLKGDLRDVKHLRVDFPKPGAAGALAPLTGAPARLGTNSARVMAATRKEGSVRVRTTVLLHGMHAALALPMLRASS
jgi:hypothetical protein